ncbi:MAG: S41 family peptidase [Bacteroidales bacterium]|nr:S41 family peptidase [Bacteroidales bacterium]
MPADSDPSPTSTFDYLWRQVDERYSLFDVKNVNWQAMYDSLRPQVYDEMDNDSLFTVLHKMLNSLNDGHVDLWGNNDVSSSEAIFLQRYGTKNFDINTVAITYLRADHHTTAGFAYNSIAEGQVLYIRYSSFSNSASPEAIKIILKRFPNVKGIVLDIRQNGGGEIQNEWNIMQMLPSEGQLLYYTQIKNGPAHSAFSEPQAVYAPESSDIHPIDKPLVLLTDRGCYSAASNFALCLKTYNNVTVMGDTTAGGLAVPAGGALPNGWNYRFGVTRTLAIDGINYENGVPPDQVVLLDPAAVALHHDNIIDSATNLILSNANI